MTRYKDHRANTRISKSFNPLRVDDFRPTTYKRAAWLRLVCKIAQLYNSLKNQSTIFAKEECDVIPSQDQKKYPRNTLIIRRYKRFSK